MTDDRFHRAVQETMRERTSSDVPFESTSRYETETGEDLRGQVESGPGDVTQAPPPSGLEVVATFHDAMPTGVTVAQDGRVFVCFPRWGDDVPFTVAEIVDGKAVAYPDQDRNVPDTAADATDRLLSVQSVVVDPAHRLWALDTGRIEFRTPPPGGAKLVEIDLISNHIVRRIPLPPTVALPTTYLNDVRFDLRRGASGHAFITDSSDTGANGIIVVDLETGESWRRLNDHPSTKAVWAFLPWVEGEPLLERQPEQEPAHLRMGADGIAISADGSRLFYCPLASRRLFSVDTDALADQDVSDSWVGETVLDHGEKGASDGLETDREGRIYVTNYEQNAVLRRDTTGTYETLVRDERLLWPDTLSIGMDRHLYITANQLHRQARFQWGEDRRRKPYHLFRTPIDAGPVLLR